MHRNQNKSHLFKQDPTLPFYQILINFPPSPLIRASPFINFEKSSTLPSYQSLPVYQEGKSIKISMSDFLNYSGGSFLVSALTKLLTIHHHSGIGHQYERIQNRCFLWRNSSHWIMFWTTHRRITQRFVLTLIYSCSFHL